jgi:hypothetical protein
LQAKKLILDTFRTNILGATEVKNPSLNLIAYFAAGNPMRSPALRIKSGFSFHYIATMPLSQGRPGYATSSAKKSSITGLLVKSHPSEAGLNNLGSVYPSEDLVNKEFSIYEN